MERQGLNSARNSGQVSLEMALAFPFLVVAAIALVEFVLFAHAESVVIGAAMDGARVAAEDGATLQDGLDRARAVLDAGLGSEAVTITTQASAEGGDVVIVSATGQFRLILPGLGPNPGDSQMSIPLQARARATKEGFRPRGGPVVP